MECTKGCFADKIHLDLVAARKLENLEQTDPHEKEIFTSGKEKKINA